MDFPSFNDFKTILERDVSFKDNFNLFLNLPIFAMRLNYVTVVKQFNICPYPNSNIQDVDQCSVWQWVYTNRLPLFWRSDFYYGYRLCYELMELIPKDYGGNDYTMLCITKEVQKFLLFLQGSIGELYCLFWLDVERLNSAQSSDQQRQLIAKIKQLYLVNGAPFQFESTLRKEILFSTCEAISMDDEIAVLKSAQCRVMESLKKYWLEQYLARMQRKEIEDEESSSDEEEEQGKDIQSRVLVDRGDDIGDVQAPHEKLKSFLESQPVYITSRRRDHNRQLTVRPLITSSTHNLFALSDTMNGVGGETSFRSQKLIPFMQASIRSNFAAGNPILDYFHETHSVNNNDNENASNLLLLWQSIESLLTRDEMKRWYNFVKSSNSTPNCPYLSLFQNHPLAYDLDSLLEMYIDDNSEYYVDLPCEVQSQLHILLPKGLGKGLLLETQEYVCKKLQPYWEQYIAHDNNSFQSTCITRRDLNHLSDSIQKEQSELFHKAQSADSVLFTSFDPSDKHTVKKIWRAVEYAEVLKNPGILHLPSRLAMQLYTQPISVGSQTIHKSHSVRRASTPGDIGPINYRGITLTPMITTISTKSHRTNDKLTRTTVYSSQPATIGNMLRNKPTVPESFSSMLKSSEHLESFYHFLASHGNGVEMGLVFWLAVEDMKDSIADKKMCSTKIRRIMRRFFKDGVDITVHCKDTTLLEIASIPGPTPFQLMDAQESIAKSLESHWYSEYMGFISTDHEKKEKVEKEEEEQEEKKPFVREHSRGLWNVFTRNVISFRRGLMDPPTLQLFKKFLTHEVLKGDVSDKKKIIGSKVVNVTKLLNDLSFWAEVERYKDMADVVNAAKHSGTYTPEDEIMIHKKAHAITNCYIDSSVPPKVQINVASEIVTMILDNLSLGNIARGLFHEAALNIFSILILYWKRFCVWRWSPQKTHSSSSSHSNSTSSSVAELHARLESCDMMLDGCILSFSLRTGLKLIQPPSQYKEKHLSQQASTITRSHTVTIPSNFSRALSFQISTVTAIQ